MTGGPDHRLHQSRRHRQVPPCRKGAARWRRTSIGKDSTGSSTPFAAKRRKGVNYHRFADDGVITVSGHHTKRGWAERALQRLQEQIAPLGVELNREKTKMVNTLNGEAFGFLGFDLRRMRKQSGDGHSILMTPKKKARKAVKAEGSRQHRARGRKTPAADLVTEPQPVRQGR